MLEFLEYIKTWGSILIAFASLIVAIVSLAKSSKTQKIQNQLNSLEVLIKQQELDRLAEEKKIRSCVEARVIHISKGNWKLKVWNSGNTTAYNVVATIEENAEVRIFDSKMPFDELEPNKSFESALLVYMGSSEKFRVTTTWEDENKNTHEKTQVVSL